MLSRKRQESLWPGQPGQIEPLPAFEQLLLRLRLLTEPPQPNEPDRRVVVELVAGLVGRQLLAVQAVVALAADHRRFALEQLHAHQAADEALVAQHKLEQVLMEGTEPQTVVNDVGVLLRYQRLEALR